MRILSGEVIVSGHIPNRLAVVNGQGHIVSGNEIITVDNLRASVAGTTGTGALVFANSPVFGGIVQMAGFQLGTSATPGHVLTANASGVGTYQAIAALPAGTSGQTLRHDGTGWVANSNIFNNGTNVGIGTTGPGSLLEVRSATNARITINRAGAWGGSPADIRFNSSDVGRDYWTFGMQPDTTNHMRLRYDVSEYLTVLTTGNVGIGTTAPTQRLDIEGQIRIRGGSPAAGRFLGGDVNGVGTWQLVDINASTTGTLTAIRGGTGIALYTANNYIRALNATTLEQRTPAQVLADIGAAGIAHGYHVPAPQPFNDSVFLRNDNTWAIVRAHEIGAAPADHTHSMPAVASQIPAFIQGVFYPASNFSMPPTIGTRLMEANQVVGFGYVQSGAAFQRIDQWGINVVGAANTGTFEARIAVYETSNGLCDKLVLNTLVTGLNTTGFKAVNADFTFHAGSLYYIVIHFGCNPVVSSLTSGVLHLGFQGDNVNTFFQTIQRTITWGTALPTSWLWNNAERNEGSPVLVRLRQAPTILPDTPTGLMVTNNGWGGVSMNWDAVAAVTSYIVEYRINGGATTQAEIFGTGWSINAAVGQTVQVRVAARNAVGTGIYTAWSAGVVIELAIPQNFTAFVSGIGVEFSWDTVSGASVYVVQWQRNGVSQTDSLVSDNRITLGNGEPAGVLIEARVAARNSHGQTNPFTVLTGGTTI